MKLLSRIQATMREGRYEITEHAVEEAEADGFAASDVKNAIRHGKIVRRYTQDPRGTRYKILGPATDGRMMYVVCRFNELGEIKVLTAYGEAHEN